MAVTRRPRVLRRRPVEEAMTPLPIPLMTPPETRTYFILGAWRRGVVKAVVGLCVSAWWAYKNCFQ
jgi:hypothetical protein